MQSPQKAPPPSNAGLQIVVISGEDAVNIVQQRTAVAPIVEVRDRNNQPVAGAIVTFTISQNASFGGGLSTLSLTTNAAGRAAVAGLTPTGTGAVQINVAAAFQGQTATATIAQTNLATAAQAAATGSGASSGSASGSGSGGGIGPGTITAIGAGVAAAGAGLVLAGREDGPPPPSVSDVRVDPLIAAQATHVFFTASGWADEGSTVVWDFGDGERTTTTNFQSISHRYMLTGTFTASVTITDPKGRTAAHQSSVTIKSLSGRWTVDAGGFFDFVQSGASLAGTYTTSSPQTSGTLTGTIGPGLVPGFENFAPGVEFTVTANNRQQFTFVGSVASNTSANGITGGIGTSSGIVVWRLTRQ